MDPKQLQDFLDEHYHTVPKTNTKSTVSYHYPECMKLEHKPIKKPCPDCDQMVKNRTLTYYIKNPNTPDSCWIKKCDQCKRRWPILDIK